ncbi:MAG: rod shape-determining protein RodA, partial [Fimbriimonas ginsengisoli]|nr:rod shape-determining protein RodA [Fimbriimonas ginsengisoli]
IALLRRIDWPLLASAGILLAGGLLALYSEGLGKEGGGNFRKQLLNMSLGLVPFVLFAWLDPAAWRRRAHALYIVNVLMLAAVLALGFRAGGAQRWLSLGPIQFQPSELAKLFTVLTLATFLASRQDSIRKLSTFGLSFLHMLLPVLLVFKQPHLGASLVMLAIWLSVSIAGGVPLRFVFGSVAVAAGVLGLAWVTPGVLHDYQKERVIAMFHSDVQENGYQALRSEIAFGAGGVFGEGYLRGEQKQGRFIPEQNTDFIFTVIGEEGGLVGCVLVLGAFAFFFYRVWLVMLEADDPYAKMIAGGILGMMLFHTAVNLMMILQMLPVVGRWLPFMSYGGTALWLCMASVGLLLNVRARERPVLFG